MTDESIDVTQRLLDLDGGDRSAPQLGLGIERICVRVDDHLARLLGFGGAHALLRRSITVTRRAHPWLADVSAGDPPWANLGAAVSLQPPDAAYAAFKTLFWSLVELLQRLIGHALVANLLSEMWPDVFPRPAKEST